MNTTFGSGLQLKHSSTEIFASDKGPKRISNTTSEEMMFDTNPGIDQFLVSLRNEEIKPNSIRHSLLWMQNALEQCSDRSEQSDFS